jgi:transposase
MVVEGLGVAASERPSKRRHSREYKERVVAEYDALAAGGGLRGSLLRREKLARRQVTEWRRQFADEAAGAPARRPKRTPAEVELDTLRRANARLEAEVYRTRLALEITGKAHELLELLSESVAPGNMPPR